MICKGQEVPTQIAMIRIVLACAVQFSPSGAAPQTAAAGDAALPSIPAPPAASMPSNGGPPGTDATSSASKYAGMPFSTIVASPWRRLGCLGWGSLTGVTIGGAVGALIGLTGPARNGREAFQAAVVDGEIGALVGGLVGLFSASLWYQTRSYFYLESRASPRDEVYALGFRYRW